MILDAFIEQRLGDGRVVHLAVPVAAISDQVHNHVACEFRAVIRSNPPDAHDGVQVLGIDVEDRHGLALGKVGGKPGRVLLHGPRGEADQVVDDDLNRAAHGVRLEIGKIESLGPDALPGERRVAVHHDGHDLVVRAVIPAIRAVACQLGPRPAHGHGIDRFEVAGVRYQMDVDALPLQGDVLAGRADVVFHVSRAQHAPRVHVFKPRDNLVDRFARRVHHHVQPPAMAHAHHGFDRAVFARRLQDCIEQRD